MENYSNKKQNKGFMLIEHNLSKWLMAADLGKLEHRIVLAVIRQTIGYHREEAEMSFRFIGKMTKMHHWTVENQIENLVNKKILLRREGKKMKWGKKIYIYRLNNSIWRSFNASQEKHFKNNASTDAYLTPETGVNNTPNKETKKTYNKYIQPFVDKLTNYKKGNGTNTIENQKPTSDSENCGSVENHFLK